MPGIYKSIRMFPFHFITNSQVKHEHIDNDHTRFAWIIKIVFSKTGDPAVLIIGY